MPPKIKIVQKPYKDIIIDRLNKQKHNNSHTNTNKKSIIHSLKTQCTPNDRDRTQEQQITDKQIFFNNFESNVKLGYKPVNQTQRKSIKRCLYPQLLEILMTEKKQKKGNRLNSKTNENSKNKKIVQNNSNLSQVNNANNANKIKSISRPISRKCTTESIDNKQFKPSYGGSYGKKLESSEKSIKNKLNKRYLELNKYQEQLCLSRQKSVVSLRNSSDKELKEKSIRRARSRKDLNDNKTIEAYKTNSRQGMTYSMSYISLLNKKPVKYN